MSAPCQSVCTPWATTADLTEPCKSEIGSLDAGLVDDALWVSSDLLFNLTGRRWPGWCQDTVRPCAQYAHADTRRSRRYNPGMGTTTTASGLGGDVAAWWDSGIAYCSCNRSDACGCSSLSQVGVGEVPITSVVEVRIDGDIVDPARYRIDNYRWIVYVPDPDDPQGRQGWPCCQDLNLPSTEPGTFEIVYTAGTAPPPGGRRSAGAYACELVLSWTGDKRCSLPKDATAVSRQGVTSSKVSPMELAKDGMVGIRDVDTWVQSILIGDRRRQAAVVVPEFAGRAKVRRVDT